MEKLIVSTELKALAQDAIDCQNACNLSGVALLLTKATAILWKQPNAGTEFVNTHPIVKLICNKLGSLSGAEFAYIQSHNECEKIANADVECMRVSP